MTHKPFPYSGFILPSSESNFFDYSQSGAINQKYPSPSNLFIQQYATSESYIYSGIYATSKKEDLPYSSRESGIFHYDGLSGQFSNYAQFTGIKNDFRSFNTYIHYYPKDVESLDDINKNNMNENREFRIPYLSSYRINAFVFNPYGAL